MDNYETPKTDIIVFDTEDVITTSGGSGEFFGGSED